MRRNPPWAQEAIKQSLAQIVERSKTWTEQGLPDLTKELGCGHYGCVYQTSDPKVVFKITTDPSEAVFVAKALEWKSPPDGLVSYYDVVLLGGITHWKKPVWVIWREAAKHVGLATWKENFAVDSHSYGYAMLFERQLRWFKQLANQARYLLETEYERAGVDKYPPGRIWKQLPKHQDEFGDTITERDAIRFSQDPGLLFGPAAKQLVTLLRSCRLIALAMMREHMSTETGAALLECMSHGLLLADVHQANVGLVRRSSSDVWVITDPGNMVPLGQQFLHVDIEVLEVA